MSPRSPLKFDSWTSRIGRAVFTRLKRLTSAAGAGRDVMLLSGSTGLGQLLVLLTSPILTRLYDPEDFGVLGVVSSLLGIISVVASLRYELAIPLPDEDTEATRVLFVATAAVLVVSSTSAIAISLYGDKWGNLVNIPPKFLWFLPIGVFLVGLYQVFYYRSVRARAFGTIAATRLSQSATMVGMQLALSGFGSFGLITGHLLGQMAGLTSLVRKAVQEGIFRIGSFSIPGMIAAARRYRRFPLASTWEGLLNALGTQFPPLVMTALFGPAAAGVYVFAVKVSQAPMQLISKAIGDVFFSHAAVAHREGRLGKAVKDTTERLIAVALPPLFLLGVAAPEMFAVVFGETWREAGVIVRYLVPWLLLVFVASPLTLIFSIMEKQAQGALFQALLLIARVVALVLGARIGEFKVAVLVYSLTSALCWTGFLVWSMGASGNSISSLFRPCVDVVGRLAPSLLVLLIGAALTSLRGTDGPVLISVVIAGFWMVRYYWLLTNTFFRTTEQLTSN